ncbi:MAG: TonB-dependent siderophore receptor [Opitutaceae bacterium]|nr:TonB-dependent siderophore receptor [Opitutaceae bacterium]
MTSTAHTSPNDLNRAAATRAAALTALLVSGGASSLFAEDYVAENETPTILPEVEVRDSKESTLAAAKFNTPLIDTPQTITVIPKEVFDQQAVTSLRDILRNSPGITFQAGEGGNPAGDQMTIRGFSARTDMFVDGVRDLGGYARDSFNLEQVEVAKGPSSSSAGRGSTGGSVNLVTKTPQSVANRNATAAIGTDDYTRATADINQPIDDDKAVRVNLMVTDAGVPGRNVVENTSWGIAPSFAFGLGRPTRVIFSWQRLEQDNVPDYGMPRQVYDYNPPVPSSNWYGLKARDYEKIEQDLLTAIIEHDNGKGFAIRNLTRFGRTYRNSIITAPRFESGSTTVIRRSDWKSRDQEDEILANQTHVDLDVMVGKINHAIAAGLEFSQEEQTNYNRVEDPATVLPTTDVYAPNPNDPYNGNITRDGAYTQGKADSVALYLFDNIFAGQRWQVNVGVRYDVIDADYKTVDAAGVVMPFARKDDVFSTRLGVTHKPTEKSSIYAGYANSFNPSSEDLILSSRGTDLSQIAPEETDSYEIGTKWSAFDDRLAFTFALFRTEKTNARTPGVSPNDPPTVLQGKERVDGAEFSIAGDLTREWTVFAGIALMDSEIVSSNTAGLAGQEFGLTPKTTFNLWTTYELPFGLTLGGGAQYMDSVFRNTAVNAETIPSYWLFNTMLAYPVNDRVSLQLNATNLFDEEYIDRVGGGHHIPGQARQVILSARFSF